MNTTRVAIALLLMATTAVVHADEIPKTFPRFEVEEHRDLFHITPAGAFPRYGISISRLRALMATLAAQGAPTNCPRSDD